MAEFDGRARVFAGVYGVPDAQGISRGREAQAAVGYLSHAGGPADRYGRKSRTSNRGRDRHGIGLYSRNVWTTQTGRNQDRPQQRDPERQRKLAGTRGSGARR